VSGLLIKPSARETTDSQIHAEMLRLIAKAIRAKNPKLLEDAAGQVEVWLRAEGRWSE
jgi:hypothetical protein